MADRKITDLTEMAAGTQGSNDLLTIVDVSEGAAADKNKKITFDSLFKGIPGDVGIGQPSPDQKLHVRSTSDDVIKLESLSGGNGPNLTFAHTGASPADNDTIGKLTFVATNDNSQQTTFADIKVISTDVSDGSEDAAFTFSTRNNGTFNERMRIDSSGNVGIGCDNPQYQIDLSASDLDHLFTGAINAEQDGGDYALKLTALGKSGGRTGSVRFITGLNTSSGSERMRIDSSGRLLRGTTSTSANANTVLQGSSGGTTGSARLFLQRGNSPANGQGLGSIFFADNSSNEGALIDANRDGGTWTSGSSHPTRLQFATTADGASSPTERMRIDSSGRIFFNENSSDLSHKYIFSGNESADVAAFQYNSNSGTYLAIKTEAANGVVELKADARSGTFPALVFRTGNVDRGRITKDGGFLVGTDSNTEYSLGRGNLNVGVASSLGNQHGLKVYVANTSFSETGGGIKFTGCRRSASSAYSFGGWYSGNGSTSVASDKEFNLRGDGNAYADGSWNGGGADYAEYFEWSDGNTSDQDRRGISVVLDGDKIREAVAGEEPIGVISGNPSVVGDADIDRWKGKYLRDDYGTHLLQTHNVVKWTETITDEDGNESTKEHDYEDWNLPDGIVVPDDAVVSAIDDNGKPFTHKILNPDYNPDTAYISREDRPEWSTVGLMGKLRIRKGQVTGTRWIKMRDVSDTVEEWLVR